MPSIPAIEDELAKAYNTLVNDVNDGIVPSLRTDITQIYAQLFNESLEEGYGKKWSKTKPGTPEFERLARMRANALYFAASKQMRIIDDLQIIKQSGGDFQSFAESYYYTQNRTWLEAEREMILANAQMAKRWHYMQDMSEDLPNLTYDTVGDANVRPAHQILQGITKPMNDPFWKTHYPPIGYRCRCDVQQNDNPVTPAKKMPDQKNMGFINKAFAFNSGIKNRVVGEAHPYLKTAFKPEVKNNMMVNAAASEELIPFQKIMISCFQDFLTAAKKVDGVKDSFSDNLETSQWLLKHNYKSYVLGSHKTSGITWADHNIEGVLFETKKPEAPLIESGLKHAFLKAKRQSKHFLLDLRNYKDYNLEWVKNQCKKELRNYDEIWIRTGNKEPIKVDKAP